MSAIVSPLEAEHYFAVSKDVPDEEVVRWSGDFVTKLFEGPYVPGFNQVPNYDVSADGKSFVVVEGGWGLTTGRLDVHLSFRQELEEALPRPDK